MKDDCGFQEGGREGRRKEGREGGREGVKEEGREGRRKGEGAQHCNELFACRTNVFAHLTPLDLLSTLLPSGS